MGAMPGEIDAVSALLGDDRTESVHAHRRFIVGRIVGHPVVVVGSRVGKVAASATATELILRFGVRSVVFTGVAGALDPSLRIGDVVVGDRLVQHDLDASPLFPRFEAPLLGVSVFLSDPWLTGALREAASRFVGEDLDRVLPGEDADRLHIPRDGGGRPSVRTGMIATGDRFVCSDADRALIRGMLPDAACVEMEGAAVAQVAYEHGVPFAVVRTISDAADDHAASHFPSSLDRIAGVYSAGVVRRFLGG